MILIWTKEQNLRNAATRSLTREEMILVGHLIISLDSCIIKRKELKRRRSQQALYTTISRHSKCSVK
jgi:hypothetical protein